MKTKKYFYEFFAGIGLVRLGLEQEGWECIWANDIAEDKMNTYTMNFGSSDFCLEDIWKVNANELPGKAFLATASFPCTDLSVAGDREGLRGNESGTFFGLIKILEDLKKRNLAPSVLMIENVVGLLTSHKGKDIKLLLKTLSELDYCVDIIEVNAIHFVPQSRPRVFIFAVAPGIASKVMIRRDDSKIFDEWRKVIEEAPEIRSPLIRKTMDDSPELPWYAFRLPSVPTLSSTITDVIEDIPHDSELWWPVERKEKLRGQMSKKHEEQLKLMINGDQFSYGTVYRRKRKTGSMAELRTDGISGCLRTPRGGSSKQILVKAGKGAYHVRLMTPREYARLQGVSDHYELPDDVNKALFGIGDAVCVPAISWIAENILNVCYESQIQEKDVEKQAV